MSNNEARVFGTFLVWTALTIILVTAMVTGVQIDSIPRFLGIVTLVVAGSVSTSAIWKSRGEESTDARRAEKTKRRSKLDRMLATLDDHDLEELRSRLMSEADGETVSLEELMTERDRRQRR